MSQLVDSPPEGADKLIFVIVKCATVHVLEFLDANSKTLKSKMLKMLIQFYVVCYVYKVSNVLSNLREINGWEICRLLSAVCLFFKGN